MGWEDGYGNLSLHFLIIVIPKPNEKSQADHVVLLCWLLWGNLVENLEEIGLYLSLCLPFNLALGLPSYFNCPLTDFT